MCLVRGFSSFPVCGGGRIRVCMRVIRLFLVAVVMCVGLYIFCGNGGGGFFVCTDL